MSKLYSFCQRSIHVFSVILFAILALTAFFRTAYVENAYEIVIQLRWDNPLFNILFLVCSILVYHGLCKLFTRIKHGEKILLILSCLWIFGASMLWTYFSKSGPASDCGSVYYAAKQFARNDFSALSYRDSYFSVYPFQLGLASFYELIFRFAGSDNFHILQGVNAICLVVCMLSQYGLCKQLFRSEKTALYSLLLTDFCIPFIMYGSYIYGEIPSFAFILFGSYMILLFLDSFLNNCDLFPSAKVSLITKHLYLYRILTGAFGFLSIVAAVWVRKNSLIFLIALGIILILYFIKHRTDFSLMQKVLLPLYFITMFVLAVQIIPLIQNMYAHRSGTEINRGVPTSTYLAMGLMEADAGPGGYNGYNFETFTVTADYDYDKASALGFSAYQERLDYFLAHPSYALSFLANKFMNQWLNVGWAIFDSIYISFGERLPIIESCFSGPLYNVLVDYMSGYQMVLYGLVALSLLPPFFHDRNKQTSSKMYSANIASAHPFYYLFLLTAVGGALFYMIWESSGRYVLPYAIFVLPHAAHGMALLESMLDNLFTKRKVTP